MGLDGTSIALRLFIEGVEIPIISINIEESIGEVTRANIRIPYAEAAQYILERSVVHVFLRDTQNVSWERREATTPEETVSGTPRFGVLGEDDPRQWKLIFQGEVGGDGKAITPNSRHVGIQCLGILNYLDFIKQFQALRGRGTFTDTERRLMGVESALVFGTMRGGGGSSSQYTEEQLALPEDQRDPNSRRRMTNPTRVVSRAGRYATADTILQVLREANGDLRAGVVRLLREFVSRTNEFWNDRLVSLRLADLFWAAENDDTLKTLFDMRVFKEYLRQNIGSVGYQFNFRGLTNLVGSFVFHDLVEHAAPSYFPTVTDDVLQALGSPGQDGEVLDRSKQADRMTGIAWKPELWWTAPPACNIIFPGQYSAAQDQSFKIAEPTRTILKIQPGVSGDRRTIADKYFAPDLQALNSLAANQPESNQHMFLLPHEVYRGINANVVVINELARLAKREEIQPYMMAYAQFQHWRSSYANHTISIQSGEPLTHLLVGYPAILVDPGAARESREFNVDRTAELALVRMSRELAMLQRIRDRLLSRIGGLSRQRQREIAWARSLPKRIQDLYQTVAPQMVGGSSTLYDESINVHSEVYIAINQGNTEITDESREFTGWPMVGNEIDTTTVSRIFGEAGSAFVPTASGDVFNIALSAQDVDTLNAIAENRPGEIASDFAGRLSGPQSDLRQVREAISTLEDALRGVRSSLLGSLSTNHTIFYVTGKSTSISREGSVSTNINGTYARRCDEDIDLDGNRGDSFERIVYHNSGGFFSENYLPGMIGDAFYRPMYGVKSLIDVALEAPVPVFDERESLSSGQSFLTTVSDKPSTDATGAQRFQNVAGGFAKRRAQFLANPRGSDGDSPESKLYPSFAELIARLGGDTDLETAEIEGFGIAPAIGRLVDYYQMVGDSETRGIFVRRVTARPVADIVDVLGAQRAAITSRSGNYYGSSQDGRRLGVGFHEFAFVRDDGSFDVSDMPDAESAEQAERSTVRRLRVLDYLESLGGLD